MSIAIWIAVAWLWTVTGVALNWYLGEAIEDATDPETFKKYYKRIFLAVILSAPFIIVALPFLLLIYSVVWSIEEWKENKT